MASSKVTVIIWGTFWQLDPAGPTLHKFPGTWVPSSEQKQSGNLQMVVSQGGALLGSVSISHAFSSEPSLQSFSPLQKRTRSMQLPSPQAKKPSWHNGSSVKSRGFTFFSLVLESQFPTEAFQSQVCFSMSKAKPAGQRIACRPDAVHWMTSRHLSLPVSKRNHSPAPLSWQSCLSSSSSSASCGAPLMLCRARNTANIKRHFLMITCSRNQPAPSAH